MKKKMSGPRENSRSGHRCLVPLGGSLTCAGLMQLDQSAEEEAGHTLLLRLQACRANSIGEILHIFLIKIVK